MGNSEHLGSNERQLLILLLGGRIQPAMMTAFHFKPAAVALVGSQSEPKLPDEARRILATRLPHLTCVPDKLLPPYQLTDAQQAIADLLRAASGYRPFVSLTGAPMPMALGAYEAARRYGCPAYYLNTAGGVLLDLTAPDEAVPLSLDISLEDYLATYDLKPDLRHKPAGAATPGHRLEKLVWDAAAAARWEGRPLFRECRRGFKFRLGDAEREIDFIGVRRNVALIASCKTGQKPWDKLHLDEVEAVAKKLGGDYCVRLFISDCPRPAPPPRGIDPFEQFQDQARSGRVVVVTGNDLPQLAEILCRELTTPTYPWR